jgi:hypothetical protein
MAATTGAGMAATVGAKGATTLLRAAKGAKAAAASEAVPEAAPAPAETAADLAAAAAAAVAAIAAATRAKAVDAESNGGTMSAQLFAGKNLAARAAVHGAIHHDLRNGWTRVTGFLPPDLVTNHKTQIDASAATSRPYDYNGPKPGPIGEAKKRFADFFIYVLLLFSLGFAAKIAAETNRYASEDWVKDDGSSCKADAPGARHRYKGKWLPVTVGEIFLLLSIRVRQGVRSVRNLSQSWAQDSSFYDVAVARLMPGKRYLEMLSFLHFINNGEYREGVKADPTKADKLYKVRWLINAINKRLPTVFEPGEFIAGDECRFCMRGRFGSFLAYFNPHKPIKHAANAYMLACSVTGFPLQFEFQVPGGVTAADVMILLRARACLLRAPFIRVLVVDSLYGGVKLAKDLFNGGMHFLGTIRTPTKSRCEARDETTYKNTPFHKLAAPLVRHIARGCHAMAVKVVDKMLMLAVAVKDKKRFSFLATSHITGVPEHGTCTIERRERGKRDPEVINSFPALKHYAVNFNGADMFERFVALYSCQYAARRYYVRLFFWLIDLIMVAVVTIILAHVPTTEECARGGKRYPAADKRFAEFAADSNTVSRRERIMLAIADSLADLGLRLQQEPASRLAQQLTEVAGRPPTPANVAEVARIEGELHTGGGQEHRAPDNGPRAPPCDDGRGGPERRRHPRPLQRVRDDRAARHARRVAGRAPARGHPSEHMLHEV